MLGARVAKESAEAKQKLTAVFVTDVVGYSRLMGDDHHATVKTLAEYRAVFSSHIEKLRGRIVNAPGDSILAEFESVVDAVNCAVEIQRELAERNAGLPENRKMHFRIGVNLGDVLVKDGKLFGDVVNIAARLEALAEPGGICISRNVHDQVHTRLDLEYDYLGEHKVKNIATPVRVYKVLLEPGHALTRLGKVKRTLTRSRRKVALAAATVVLVALLAALAWNLYRQSVIETALATFKAGTALPLPDKPSIAILPFANMSDDKEQDSFADGITDDIITDISKVGGMFVIARNTAFAYKGRNVNIKQIAKDLGIRYVLEGSVRRAGKKVRINAQLIDAATDGHLWADRYDGQMDDIFALQDKITKQIVSALAVTLTADEQKQVARKETNSPEAYDAYLKGMTHYRRRTPEDFVKAIPFFTKAIDHDPHFSQAHAALADVYSRSAKYGWPKYLNLSFGEAWLKARQNLDEAMKDPVPLAYSVASYLHRGENRYQAAIEAAEQAIVLDPGDPAGYGAMASALIRGGKPAQAVDFINKAMRLDPKNSEEYLELLGLARFGMEQYEESAIALEKATQAQPDYEWGYLWLAATYGQLGQKAKARAALTTYNARRDKIGWHYFNTLQGLDILTFAEKRDLDRLREGLRVAGVPPGKPVPNSKQLIYQTKEGVAVKGATTIEAKRAKELFDRKTIFVDVRADNHWNKGHIPGAVHLEAKKAFNRPTLSKLVEINQEVVIYCAGPG
jgi:TolB-like protein/class 3 adenylate cyclase